MGEFAGGIRAEDRRHRAYDARAAIVHSLAIAADMRLPVNAYMPERPVLRTRFSHELAREAGLSI
jgi:hypothetical protein